MSVAPAAHAALSPSSASDPVIAPTRAALIVNARSFRASANDLAGQAIAAARRAGARVMEASDAPEMSRAIDQAIAEGRCPLAVLAGDGTVQAIADYLARLPADVRRPRLLVLAGGRTNLIASDFNGRGNVVGKLERVLGDGDDGRVEMRRSLVVEQEGAPSRHGFFLAGGLVDSAIRACAEHRDGGAGALRRGALSNAWCLSKLAIGGLFRARRFALPQVRVEGGALGAVEGGLRVLAISTLRHASGPLDPYADRGAGDLRVTAVSTAPSAWRFWSTFVLMLCGRFTAAMRPDRGYLSGRCETVSVLGLHRYALDGEFFECDPSRPVTIHLGAELQFLVPAAGKWRRRSTGHARPARESPTQTA